MRSLKIIKIRKKKSIVIESLKAKMEMMVIVKHPKVMMMHAGAGTSPIPEKITILYNFSEVYISS